MILKCNNSKVSRIFKNKDGTCLVKLVEIFNKVGETCEFTGLTIKLNSKQAIELANVILDSTSTPKEKTYVDVEVDMCINRKLCYVLDDEALDDKEPNLKEVWLEAVEIDRCKVIDITLLSAPKPNHTKNRLPFSSANIRKIVDTE